MRKREEEKRITEAVTAITAKTQAVRVDTNQVEQRLQMALDLTSTIAEAYKQAPEHIRKIMNHVFFDRVLVFSDPNAVNGVRLQTKLQEPFARLTNSDMRQTEAQWRLTTTKHAPVFNGGRVLRSLRSGKLFTQVQGLSKSIVVELRRFELLTSSMRTKRATNCAIAPQKLPV